MAASASRSGPAEGATSHLNRLLLPSNTGQPPGSVNFAEGVASQNHNNCHGRHAMTADRHIPPRTAEAHEYAYNLFRNKQRPEIVCAVPEVRPVPHFIDLEQWTFEQPLRPLEAPPPGFDSKAAHAGVRFNGFYLFHALAAAPAFRTALEFVSGAL